MALFFLVDFDKGFVYNGSVGRYSMYPRRGGLIMRLFIAIQLSEAMRDAIGRAQDALYEKGVRGRYTPRENLHLTLAFIGEYHDPERVLEVMNNIPFEPFELTLQGVGAFGDLWWIGLKPSQQLQNYVRRLRHGLAEAGVPFDRKRFAPHVTILRKANGASVKPVAPVQDEPCMIATHAALMRSDRGKNGMIYTEIF
jgi:2'-5' RNA ligase